MRAAAFVAWFAAWGALALAAPHLPQPLAIGLAIALFLGVNLLPRCDTGCADPAGRSEP